MLDRATDRLCRGGAAVENLAHSASFHACVKGAPSKPGIKHLGRMAPLGRPHRATQHPLLPLSSKCPELNVMENVWQFMRDNWLSNRIFAAYDDIVAHCCEAWNKLIDQPWRIISIGMRDWAHRY